MKPETLQKHQFTLILKNVDEKTPHLEDELYKTGCDDALINFRNGTVYLDFDRGSLSLEKAVMSAINAIESSGFIVAGVAPEDLVTESEVAKRLNTNRQTISLWIKRERRKSHPFPKPVMKLSGRSPLWKWREIVEWLYRHNLLNQKEIVENAIFFESINAVLEERDESTRKLRQNLLKQLKKRGYG